MIDLHQGFSGEELRDAPPTVASAAMSQLEAVAALSKGRLRIAALQQVEVWKTLGRVAAGAARDRIARLRR